MDFKRPGFTHVVAMDSQNGIGKNGNLVWKLPGDMAHFKKVTSETQNPALQNIVIMGRVTWESIPPKFRPLPNRINLVLTRDETHSLPEGVFRFSSFEDALGHAQTLVMANQAESIHLIGGASLYQQTISHPSCEKLILTRVHHTFECDAFYPTVPPTFSKTENSVITEDNGVSYHFETWKRSLLKNFIES